MNRIKEQVLEKSCNLYRTRPWIGILLLFVVIIGFHSWSLMRFPQPFVDEGWYGARALGFLETGRAFGTLDSNFMVEYDGYWTYFPLLPVLLHALSFRLAGGVSLLAMRLVSLLFGLWLLTAVYLLAYRLCGRREAVFSVLLVAFSWPFCISAHWARTDIMAAALGFTALALYVNSRQQTFWVNVLAGFCVGLAFEFHPNAAIFGLTLVVMAFVAQGWGTLKHRSLWGIVCGGALGGLFYAALHILRYPDTYFTFQRLFFSATHTPPILTFDLGVMLEAFRNMAISMFLEVYPLSLLVMLAVVALWRRPSLENRWLIAAVLSLTLGYTLWVRNRMPYYPIILTPIFDIVAVGVVLDEFSRPWRRRVSFYARRVLVLGLSLASLIRPFTAVLYPYYQDYENVQQQIKAVIVPGESIIGPQTFWFGLYEHNYHSWEEIMYYQRYALGSSVEEALQSLHPDVFIADGYVRLVAPGERRNMYDQHVSLDLFQVRDFLDRRGTLLIRFNGGVYGEVFVYRINWD